MSMYIGRGYALLCYIVSLIVLLRGFPCLHDFLHGASNPYIPIHSFFHLFRIFLYGSRRNAATLMRLATEAEKGHSIVADISILPSYHSSIIPFFHPSILLYFHPAFVMCSYIHVSNCVRRWSRLPCIVVM